MCLSFEIHFFMSMQSTSTIAMYYKEAQDVEDLFGYLTEVVAEKPITAPIPTAKHVETLKDLLERWPADFRFPRTWFKSLLDTPSY